MLIRKAQLDALGQTQRMAYVQRLWEFARRELEQEVSGMKPEALREFVETQIDRALQIGITSQRHIAIYACARILSRNVVSDADLGPPFRVDSKLSSSERLDAMIRTIHART
jgi:hypothetical protein